MTQTALNNARPDPAAMTTAEAFAFFQDKYWRLNNLYWIINDEGERVRFEMRDAQRYLFENYWYLNLILKARQLGFTTFIDLFILDECVFVPNLEAGIIAHTRSDAGKIFRRKIEYPYQQLPDIIRHNNPLVKDTQEEFLFTNNSSISVGTSMRSGTCQMLHVCLTGDTGIYTKNACVKPISEIQPGELVLTSKGSYRPAVGVLKTPLKETGQKLLEVDVFGYYEPLRITDQHHVLTRQKTEDPLTRNAPQWKPAGELVSGDYIAFPTREVSNKLKQKGTLPFGETRIEPTFDLGWLCGFYLAEGSLRVRSGRPQDLLFSIHRDETEALTQALTPLISKMGTPRRGAELFSIYDHDQSKTRVFRVNSKPLSEFLFLHFGDSKNKTLPDKVWSWGSKFVRGLIKGYFDGDGHYGDTRSISVTSVRRQLIDQMRFLLISMRYGVPTVYRSAAGEKYGRNCQEAWVLKLNGPGNWKFREEHELPLPDVDTWAGKWRIAHGKRPDGRKFWRRGKDYYWLRVRSVSESGATEEEFVYDVILNEEPHNYVTVNGVVHNSEFGKLAAKYPEKAREVVTGSLETVAPGMLVWIESTAEGRYGYFYDYCQAAQAHQQAGGKLTTMDYAFHFFPWWKKPTNVLAPEGVVIPQKMVEYFGDLESKIGQALTAEQKAWYIKKAQRLGDDIKREHPSTPAEAFEQAILGAYFTREFRMLREGGRICNVPVHDGVLVDTWWDIGWNDATGIWFTQDVGREVHVVDFYKNNNEGLKHYAEVLQDKGYRYGVHAGPHDIEAHEFGTGTTRKDTARALGIDFQTVPRIADKRDAIQAARNFFSRCWFDEVRCDEGLVSLEQYRKEWDEKLGTYKNRPLHDEHSNPADAFQTLAVGHPMFSRRQRGRPEIKTESSLGWT